MVAVVLGSGIVFLDSTVVNVALPKIGEDLRSGLLGAFAAENFVYYSYLLSLSALLILAGALNDYYGRRRVFGLGLLAFGSTSLLCGLAPNLELLVLGGAPIREPVVFHGPFVMNTREEIYQAVQDYHAGRMGQIPATSLPS